MKQYEYVFFQKREIFRHIYFQVRENRDSRISNWKNDITDIVRSKREKIS